MTISNDIKHGHKACDSKARYLGTTPSQHLLLRAAENISMMIRMADSRYHFESIKSSWLVGYDRNVVQHTASRVRSGILRA